MLRYYYSWFMSGLINHILVERACSSASRSCVARVSCGSFKLSVSSIQPSYASAMHCCGTADKRVPLALLHRSSSRYYVARVLCCSFYLLLYRNRLVRTQVLLQYCTGSAPGPTTPGYFVWPVQCIVITRTCSLFI